MEKLEKWFLGKIIVLAKTRQEFEKYLDENGLTDSEAVHGYEPQVMRGIRASKVEVIGKFWDRKDAAELKKIADSRLIEMVDITDTCLRCGMSKSDIKNGKFSCSSWGRNYKKHMYK